MSDFYKAHGLDESLVEEELFKKKIFDEILDKFDKGELTCRGKNGTERLVTNSKQAYAMACKISESMWKKQIKVT